MKPIDQDDVSFHGHEQTAQGLSRLRRESSAVTAWCGGAKELIEKLGRNDPVSPAAQRGRFKRCCLRSGCF